MTAAMTNSPPTTSIIYKILTPDQWRSLDREGVTRGSALDIQDGFIHFSTQAQLRGTLDIHFAGSGPLILAAVRLGAVNGAELRWESSRGGDSFPHLYGPLPRSAVFAHWPLHESAQGRYALPAELGTLS